MYIFKCNPRKTNWQVCYFVVISIQWYRNDEFIRKRTRRIVVYDSVTRYGPQSVAGATWLNWQFKSTKCNSTRESLWQKLTSHSTKECKELTTPAPTWISSIIEWSFKSWNVVQRRQMATPSGLAINWREKARSVPEPLEIGPVRASASERETRGKARVPRNVHRRGIHK